MFSRKIKKRREISLPSFTSSFVSVSLCKLHHLARGCPEAATHAVMFLSLQRTLRWLTLVSWRLTPTLSLHTYISLLNWMFLSPQGTKVHKLWQIRPHTKDEFEYTSFAQMDKRWEIVWTWKKYRKNKPERTEGRALPPSQCLQWGYFRSGVDDVLIHGGNGLQW